ncbi:activator of hsp90 atpase 1 family protein [Colletotrichum kahawae]|uniref:Activator of hsp90 atpase 1 family protein n=1 Tax=Colletotrichum kahawae TaxID=34407 RepID=A0AAE0CYI3_COLKA|nr:activator of hsp90 atpase 1 family protein [Colletotrichum kahawae]
MGVTHSVATEIEIAAPPATVKSVVGVTVFVSCYRSVSYLYQFLDWHRFDEWTKVWKMSTKGESKKPSELKEGDVVSTNLKGMAFTLVILENSKELFRWNVSLPYIFSGAHSFYFRASEKTPGGTTMIQTEEFSGLLAFLMKPFWGFKKKTLANWREFDADFKKESERISGQRSL